MNGLFVVTNGILRNITRGRGNCEISQFLQAHLPPRKKKKNASLFYLTELIGEGLGVGSRKVRLRNNFCSSHLPAVKFLINVPPQFSSYLAHLSHKRD